MPPKVNISREAIIDAAVEVGRTDGAQALNARTVATVLGCSTQPIFSNFATMEQLRLAVVEKANSLCESCIRREIHSGLYPAYKATGMAYIRFAKEETELFRLLYMRDRRQEITPPEFLEDPKRETMVLQNTGLDEVTAKRFHLEMWACVHGIATMFATGFVDLPWELVSNMLTDVYQGLRKQYAMG